mmetsp:Transcript_59115/g.185359  ORF Transcript_59115/g.185359 Transcript_59115/m.185359 type:complete len:203 (-) Transcript_59115:222-830(-)
MHRGLREKLAWRSCHGAAAAARSGPRCQHQRLHHGVGPAKATAAVDQHCLVGLVQPPQTGGGHARHVLVRAVEEHVVAGRGSDLGLRPNDRRRKPPATVALAEDLNTLILLQREANGGEAHVGAVLPVSASPQVVAHLAAGAVGVGQVDVANQPAAVCLGPVLDALPLFVGRRRLKQRGCLVRATTPSEDPCLPPGGGHEEP